MSHRLTGQKTDEENYAMYEAAIKKGREEFKKGNTVDWESVKKKLNRRKK